MKVETIKRFRDLREQTLRHPGDIFTVSKKRYKEINSTTAGQLVQVVVEKQEIENEKIEGEKDYE